MTDATHFVHIYHVVRSKFGVVAADQKSAVTAAMSEFCEFPRNALETESAEEITGYLVDDAGDEECQNSTSYDPDGEIEQLDCFTMKMSLLEFAAVMAGLRMLQDAMENSSVPPEIEDILSGGGSFRALDSAGIDALCE